MNANYYSSLPVVTDEIYQAEGRLDGDFRAAAAA